MLKILVVSYHPWRDDISLGNTLSNIFQGMDDKFDFANLYIRDDKPCNKIVHNYFHISEKNMAQNILSRRSVGEFVQSVNEDDIKENFSKSYNTARRLRWDVLLMAQDLLGILSNWKSDKLDEFIDSYKPDIIFGPLGRVPISNIIMTNLSSRYKIPLVTYAWDDHFSLKKHSLSPFFWMRLFIERHYIRICAKQSIFLYTITPLMKIEYSRIFRKECKLLYKGFSFETRPTSKKPDKTIKIIYMGNIGAGRYETLKKIATVVNGLNENEVKFTLDIYTMSPVTKKTRDSLNNGACRLLKPVSSNEVMNTMQKADILLHVEPQSLNEKMQFRLSFSTKIVDYLYNAKCILAVGENTGTIDYLKKNDCALIAKDVNEIKNILETIYISPNILEEYSDKSWMCGLKNHQITNIQDMLFSDFEETAKRTNYANK